MVTTISFWTSESDNRHQVQESGPDLKKLSPGFENATLSCAALLNYNLLPKVCTDCNSSEGISQKCMRIMNLHYSISGISQIIHSGNINNNILLYSFKQYMVLIHAILVILVITSLVIMHLWLRKKAERNSSYLSNKLSYIEKLQNAIFDTANAGIIFLDRNRKILLANKWWTDKTGFSLEELKMMTNDEILFPEDIDHSLPDELLSGKISGYRINKRYLRKDKSYFWGDLSVAAVKVLDKDELLIIGVVTDITDHIESRKIIDHKNVELERIIEERNRFISMLAHDLRSPFNTILGFSDLLVQNSGTNDNENFRENIRILNYSINSTYNLFTDIISWAKLQTGKLSFNPGRIDLFLLLTETIKIDSPYAESKKIHINLHVKPDKYITADPDMIKSVIRNILSNALKFTSPEGIVTITSYDSENNPEDASEKVLKILSGNKSTELISISDTGIGIEHDHLNMLFDKASDFSNRGTADETGTGIGLTLCKEFINKHGGKIWAESVVGKGSTFYFTSEKAILD